MLEALTAVGIMAAEKGPTNTTRHAVEETGGVRIDDLAAWRSHGQSMAGQPLGVCRTTPRWDVGLHRFGLQDSAEFWMSAFVCRRELQHQTDQHQPGGDATAAPSSEPVTLVESMPAGMQRSPHHR